MLANVGRIDRMLRVAIGVALVTVALAGPELAWGWIGALLMLSGMTRHCPIYALLGIDTCGGR